MSFFSNYYLYTHRLAYAISTIVVLLGLLAWALLETSADLVERKELRGELIEVAGDTNAPGGAFPVGVVQLADGGKIKLMLPVQQPLPRVGDRIPLIMERYDDGKVLYAFDNLQWTADGGVGR